MKVQTFFLTLLIAVFLSGCSVSKPGMPLDSPGVSFDKIKALDGEWESASSKDKAPERVKYRVTSAGTAVEEILFPGQDFEMVSMYYKDGGAVMMAHYCALGNQPLLHAKAAGEDKIVFSFVGPASIDPKKDHHMHELHLTFLGPDKIRQEWIGFKDGKVDHRKEIELTRVKSCGKKCSAHAGCKKKKGGCPLKK